MGGLTVQFIWLAAATMKMPGALGFECSLRVFAEHPSERTAPGICRYIRREDRSLCGVADRVGQEKFHALM
jgi:hypothetical protein